MEILTMFILAIVFISFVPLVKSLRKNKADAYEIKGFIRGEMDDIFIKDNIKLNHIGWINIQTGGCKRKG